MPAGPSLCPLARGSWTDLKGVRPMKWYEVSLITSFEASDLLQTMLLEQGAGGVELDDPALLHALEGQFLEADEPLPRVILPPDRPVVVKAYFHSDPGLMAKVAAVRAWVADLVGRGLVSSTEVGLREVSEDDWASAWKQFFSPIRIGRHLLVVPSWKLDEVSGDMPEGSIPIVLDPGMAFGTGNHPTTSLCLQLMEEHIRPGGRVLDIGTGSGILAIAAAKLGATGWAVDIDSLAVEVARENLRANGVLPLFGVSKCDITDPEDRAASGLEYGAFETVVANIVPEVIGRLLPSMARLAVRGGRIILSGIIGGKASIVDDCVTALGLKTIDTRSDGEWVALVVSAG